MRVRPSCIINWKTSALLLLPGWMPAAAPSRRRKGNMKHGRNYSFNCFKCGSVKLEDVSASNISLFPNYVSHFAGGVEASHGQHFDDDMLLLLLPREGGWGLPLLGHSRG